MNLELRRRLMATEPTDIIIDARKGGVSGDAANDAALMEVIYAQGWSRSPLYMTKREAEAVKSIGTAFRGNKEIKNFEALYYFTKITSIPDNAFNQCSNLTKISIPIQVTHLGTTSFGHSPQLDKIPSHITTFGAYPFQYSTRTRIDISEINRTTTGNLFQFMYSLESIELPEQITEIAYQAFQNCSSLKSLHIHKDITKIGTRLFLNTNGSVKSITVADDNPIYDSRENCNAIIETATNKLISGCAKTVIPNGVVEIISGACQYVGLESLTIPPSVTKLGGYCFSGYKGTYVEFPDTIISNMNTTQIMDNAANLTEAIVGSGISYIGDYSFMLCPKLTKLTFKCNGVVAAKSNCLTNVNSSLVVYVPSGLVTDYKADPFWSKFNIQAIPQ